MRTRYVSFAVPSFGTGTWTFSVCASGSRQLLETVPFEKNSDDFVFDNELIVQALHFGVCVGEISCPTRYFPEASSINFRRSVAYGFGVLGAAMGFRLQQLGAKRFAIFERGNA